MADIHPGLTQNVYSLGFGARSHPPPALNFGFGMANPSFNPLIVPSLSPMRSNKRRLEGDSSDDGMDTRSPTPEPMRRLPPKRLKGDTSLHTSEDQNNRDNKPTKSTDTRTISETDDIDVGFMLALLPPQSLMPLITSLIKGNPSLKQTILSSMPRPSLDSALQALSQSSAKLKNAYPYTTPTFSFGQTNTNSHPLARNTASLTNSSSLASSSGMRESYIQSRVAPHLAEFTTNALSLLSFFTITSPSKGFQESKVHPSETFTYLAAVTREILSLPLICQAALRQTLIPRLMNEWKRWVRWVDDYVNNQGGMFGLAMLKGWESQLDEFAHISNPASLGLGELRQVRDEWVTCLGCLVGRVSTSNSMEDDNL